MNDFWTAVLICIGVALTSYLIGSCNMAILISKFHKARDIRDFGSGNAGMANMLRTFGRRAAVYTFVGDFLKGALVVALSRLLCQESPIPFDIGYLSAIFAILGHIFPVYFKFKGGKGVATAFGAMLMLNWVAFAVVLTGLVPMLFIIRIVSAVSLCGASLYPVLSLLISLLRKEDLWTVTVPNTAFSLIIAGLTFYAHRENILRLRNGTENFFGEKKK